MPFNPPSQGKNPKTNKPEISKPGQNQWDIYNEGSQTQPSVPAKSAYQQNMEQPVNDKWYAGNVPTSSEIYGRIYDISQSDPEAASEIYNGFMQSRMDSSSPWFAPYMQPTNQAVSNLQSMGFDMDNLNREWVEANRGWIEDNLIFSGTTNSPTKPGKKATADQRLAYELYQWDKSENDTQKAEKEWTALQEEASYLANDPNHNYSPEQIIESIYGKDGEKFAKKYPMLASMDSSLTQIGGIRELNRGINYSKDNLNTVIWRARNDGGTGDWDADTMLSVRGGNRWTDDPEISAKLNWNDANTYAPYSVGMTAGDEGRYFGVYSFGEKEIERLKNRLDPRTGEPLDPDDATAMKMRDNVLDAYETTNKAKRELGVFRSELDRKLEGVKDPEQAQKIVEDLLDSEVYDKNTKESIKFDTLKKMDASMDASPDSLVKTTEAIDYRKQDMIDYAMQKIQSNASKKTSSEKENDNSKLMASAGVSDVGGTPYVPKTQAEIDEEKALDAKVVEAAETVDGVASETEQTVMKKAGSTFFDRAVDYFNKLRSNSEATKVLVGKSGEEATKSYFNTMMDTMKDVGYYNAIEERLAENQGRYDELEAKYGDIELLQQDAEPRKQFQIGDITFIMDLTEGDQEKGVPAEYTITDFYAPGRGGGMIMDEIIDYGNDDDKIAEAEKVRDEATAEANKILAAHAKAESYGEGWKNEVEEYKSLSGKIQMDQQWIDEHQDDYDAKYSQLQEQNKSLNRMRTVMGWLGMDTTGMDEAQTYLSFMSQFYNEPQLNNSDETKLQSINRMAEMSGKTYTRDYQSEQLHNGMEEIDRQLDYIQMTEEYIQENDLQIPAEVRKNMELEKQDLENERRAFEYSTILTDNDPVEISKAVAAGKEFEQKYGKGNMDYWVSLFPNADVFRTIGNQERYVDSDGNFYDDVVSEDDQRTYYYLLGKKVLEMGDSLDEAIAKIGTDPGETETALREAFSDAGEYQRFMEDENTGYGVWSIREFNRSASYGSEMVDSGVGGGITANAMATAVSPAESVASALELLDTAVTGKRFNSKSFARRFGAFKENTRAATRQSILDTWGTDGQENFLTKLAYFGYEIYCNRGDSLMNSMAFGSIFNVGGPAGDMINEFLGASPMGASAALSAAAEAIENGANTDQAWLIAGTSFLAETLTEAVTLSNIKGAFDISDGLSMETLGDIVKEWLTKSGLEELTGETANDLFENYFNSKAEEWFQNPNFQSDHNKMVERFLGEGMKPDEAEKAAYEEEIKGMLHTALVSYISAGSNVLISTGKAAVNSVDYYKSTTRKLQQNGYNVSTMGLMWNDWKNRKSTSIASPQASSQTATEARPAKGAPAPNNQNIQTAPIASKVSAQEAGNAVAETGTEQEQTATPEQSESATTEQKATTEQQESASDVIAIENAKDGDQNTQSASMASVLDTGLAMDASLVDRAGAAAAMIGNVFGENASSQIQDILIGAAEGKVNLTLVKTAIQNAVLGNGEATQLVQSEEFQNATAQEKAQMLAETIGADNDNQEVQNNIFASVMDYRSGRKISNLAANGHFDQAQEAQNDAKKSARAAEQAQEDLKIRQDELEAAEGNRKAADDLAIHEPSLDHTKEAKDAQAKLVSATAVEQEYEQAAKNAEAAKQEAEAKAKKVTEDAMTSARQMSKDAMAQEDQQRAETAAQLAEQQRIAEEQKAQEQAEEDERTGKTQEDADLAAIDAQIEKLNVKGEQAEKIRQQLRQFYRDLNDGNIDTSKMLTDAESALALGAMSRRLGVMIEVDQKGELAEGQDGKYSNGKILLSNKLTVGQAMVEVALHEITHSLEGTKSYGKYKSTVLGILYSTPEQLQNAVGERIARYARQGVTLTEGEAEAELVADFAKDTKRFANRDTIARMMDAGLGGKMRNTLHNVNQFLRNMRLTGQEKVNAENLRKAERLYIKAINERRSINTHPSSEQFSVNQFAQAAGLFYNEVNITGKNGEILAGPGVYNVDPALLNDPNYKGPKPARIEQITPEMMENTPVGQLTNAAQALGTMDRETAGKVHKMFADLMTMCTNLQDTNIVWEIAGSTLYSEFSAIKSNSDKQYSNTVDFGTICTKTQAVINQLSRDMLRLGRGLTSQEILQVYNDVYNADLKVPCPVCYVFSRWLGVPSLLENIRQYQNRFLGEEGKEVDQAETQRRINEFIEKAQSDYGIDRKSAKGLELYNQNLAKERQNALDRQERIKNGKDGIAELEAKIAKYKDQLAQKPTRRDWQNNLAKAEQKLAEQKEALAQAESDYDNAVVNVYAKAINKKKADIEKSIKDKLVAIEGDDKGKRGVNDDIRDAMKEGKPYDNLLEKRKKLYADIDKLNEQLREVDAYNWVTQSLCYMTQDGDFVIDPEFKRTKNEILLDLNRTGEFAKDTKNWTYRCTRGAGMGKAILPYSGASIGDSVLGEGARAMANPFNDNDGKGAFNALRSAIIKAKRQNLIGGQRFQSTSDFRPEWGLDYIMTFIEQQAIGSNGQLCTKVNEAVPMYASVGIDTNCSIMPYADGYHEPAAGEIEKMSEMERKSRVVTFKDADGTEKTVILDFSDVTGMEYGAARIFSKSFDNVQMIMVGINDIHIRACLGSEEIDFVIPWHASGNTKGQLASMMKTVNETLTNSSDYTKTQTDAIANKEGLKEAHNKLDNGETLTDAEKELIRKEQMRDARIRLLTGGTLTSTDRARIAESEFLTSLYERFEGKTLDGKELPHDSNYWVEVPDYDGNTTSERVKMTSGQAEQIFPYEYWDTSLTKDQADENGWRFVQYCQELGLVPRFSGANQKNEKTGEVTRFGNFSGAVYDNDGNIVGYNKDSMAKGYWKTLIDRKMYDNNGNYRTQKQIDASKVNAGSLMQNENGERIHVGSNIPDQTSGATYRGEEAEAKYKKADEALLERTKAIIAKGDKQSKEYKQAVIDLERMNAYDRAKAETNTQYDLSGEINPEADMTNGQMLQLLKDAGMDYQDAIARGDMESAQEAMDFYAEQKGYTEKAYHGSDFFGFTEFDMEESQGAVFVTYDKDLARTYSEADDVKPIYESNLDTASDEELIRLFKGANKKAGNTILDVTVNPDTGAFDVTFEDGETESYERSEIVDGLKSFDEDFSASTGDLNSETYVADSLRHGIYGLYARPGNQLVIDGQGKPFGETPVPWSDKGLSTREIAEYAKAQGYDSVRINNIIDRGHHWNRMDLVPRDIGIFFNQEDLKSADIVTKDNNGKQIPLDQRFTDSPDLRYSIHDDTGNENLTEGEMLQILQDAGITTGQNNLPGQPTMLPGMSSGEGGNAQRQFGSKTAQESDALHQEVKDYLYTHSDYVPDSNQAQIDRATDWVRSKANDSDPDGYRTALEEVLDPSFDYRSADGQARMLTVMSMAALKARDGDQSAMADELRLADAYNQQGTDLGRQLQARKIFRLMTPLGRRTTLQQEVARINQEYKNNGKDTQVELSEWVLKAAEEAQTEEDFEKVRKAAEAELAQQMPANWKEKIQTWRMLSMLANTRTHIRNILGNAIFMPTVGLKNAIGTGLENVFIKDTVSQKLRPDELVSESGHLTSYSMKTYGNDTNSETDRIFTIEFKNAPNEWVITALRKAGCFYRSGVWFTNKGGLTRGEITKIISDANIECMEYEGISPTITTKGERTKAIRYTDDAKAFAKEDVKRMHDTLTGEAKYSPEGRIQQNKKAFGQGKGILSRTIGKGVQAVADANSWALEKEDWIFLSKHYRNALASYMTANGLTSADMNGSTLEKARNYAVLEAQKATYRDANAVSSWLNKASRKGGVGGFLVDTVLPFKKTPANILRRGIEYSPVGLLHSLATARKSLDLYESWTANGRKGAMPKGAKSMTEVLDKISSGLTGTMIAGLGALGYALGAIKLGFGGDDDDELEKERGSQEYSVELFGHSFTIDWAAPVCMPFFTGAALYKEFSEAGNVDDVEDVADAFGKFINSLGSISEPVFNLSMLDGVSSLLKSASSTQKDKIPVWELLQNIGANYVSSLVPSFSGALARTIDTTRRQNYVEPGDPLRIWKQKVEQAENKIPWLSMRNIPYRNVWGEADVSAPGEAFLENFILPGYLNKMNDDKLTQELQRVYDQTGAASVIPKTASKTVGTKKLTDQEYDRYVVTRGQTAKQLLNDLIGRDEFIALTPTDQSEGNPEAQVNLIGEVWKYANAVARHEIDPTYTMDKWIASAYADGDPVSMIFAREEEKAQKAYGAQMKNDLFTAITAQDAETIGACLEGMRQAGEDNKSIRTSVMNNFRDQYKEAYRNGDQETMDAIKYGMLYLDLEDQSFTDDDEDPKSVFKKWRDAVDKGE